MKLKLMRRRRRRIITMTVMVKTFTNKSTSAFTEQLQYTTHGEGGEEDREEEEEETAIAATAAVTTTTTVSLSNHLLPLTENEVDGYKLPLQELESMLHMQLTVDPHPHQLSKDKNKKFVLFPQQHLQQEEHSFSLLPEA
jgi:hypothetical protein